MLKWIATALGFMLAVDLAFGADLPLGKWNTIDDKTGNVKSGVQDGADNNQPRPKAPLTAETDSLYALSIP